MKWDKQIFRVVDYFGLNIALPPNFEWWVCTHENGVVEAFSGEVEIDYNRTTTRWVEPVGYSWTKIYLGSVDLEGMDWKQTLKKY